MTEKKASMKHRDYTLLNTTQSLCPECLALVPVKIIARRGRVYFRKTCPTHGAREDFVCSDVKWYDRMEYSLPAKIPAQFGMEPDKGCPYDCGLCTEHEQHTCIGLVEVTSSCNLTCPMCYASSSPGGKHLSLADCQRAIDRLVEVEGKAEILQLSGGEPTTHPQLEQIIEYALSRDIEYVMINSNGIRFAKDPSLVEMIARRKDRVEIYFQLDGLNDAVLTKLRGEPLLETKMAALDALGAAGIHVTLVPTLQGGVNDDQIGPLVEFGLSRPYITGISFQPATYSGRHFLPDELEQRITFPDVIKAVAAHPGSGFAESDFLPLPCAHPNCHQIAIAYRKDGVATPVNRFIDASKNFDLLANGISFTRKRSKELIVQYLARQACCGGSCGPDVSNTASGSLPMLGDAASRAAPGAEDEFFTKILAEQLGSENLFRITITSFLDVYNFDVRRVMRCCTHHVLPSGHLIPFCAYQVLYRPGHVPLPELKQTATTVGKQAEFTYSK